MTPAYDLAIGGLRLRVESERSLRIPDHLLPFVTGSRPLGGEPAADEVILVRFGQPDLRSMGASPVLPGVYRTDRETVRTYRWGEGAYAVRIEPDDAHLPLCLWIPEAHGEEFCARGDLLPYLALDRLLLRHDRILLHAAGVLHEGRAILFSAPSGVGKSTQAELWRQFAGAEPINGDKIILSAADGVCMAYGGPIAGSSHIYRSISAPVAAIVMIAQGTRNTITTLSPRHRCLSLYREAVKSAWDEAFNRHLLTVAESISRITEVLSMACLPDETAVRALKQFMTER